MVPHGHLWSSIQIGLAVPSEHERFHTIRQPTTVGGKSVPLGSSFIERAWDDHELNHLSAGRKIQPNMD